MNSEEIQSLIKQLKATGLSEEQIMDVFYETFEKGEMDRKDLETLAEAMGYELTDEFKNEPTPDPIEAGSSEEAAEGEITKEEAEAVKAIEPGESAEEFKEKVEEVKEGEGESEAPAEPEKTEETKTEEVESKKEESEESMAKEGKEEESEEESEEDWEKAQKLFRI
jgi:hypothetical protein